MRNLFGVFLALFSALYAAPYSAPKVNPGELQILSVEPSPQSDNVRVHISFPKEGEVKSSNPVNMEARIEGFPLGIDTELPRTEEIFNDPEGQSIHIFIDDRPYFSINEAFIDALDDNEIYYDQKLDFDIPFKLAPGAHVIRMFPVTSFNESVKARKAFESRVFYMEKTAPLKDIDLSRPYLTYNEPQDEYDYHPDVPILLDFYVTNCQISTDGYKVKLFIDGKKERVLTSWVPYYIYGLTKGKHKIRLQLLDPMNKVVPGLFNDVEREIVLH